MLDNKNNKYYGVDSGCGSPQNWGNFKSAYSLRSHQSWWTSKGVKGAVLGLGLATLLPINSVFGADPIPVTISGWSPLDNQTPIHIPYGTDLTDRNVALRGYDGGYAITVTRSDTHEPLTLGTESNPKDGYVKFYAKHLGERYRVSNSAVDQVWLEFIPNGNKYATASTGEVDLFVDKISVTYAGRDWPDYSRATETHPTAGNYAGKSLKWKVSTDSITWDTSLAGILDSDLQLPQDVWDNRTLDGDLTFTVINKDTGATVVNNKNKADTGKVILDGGYTYTVIAKFVPKPNPNAHRDDTANYFADTADPDVGFSTDYSGTPDWDNPANPLSYKKTHPYATPLTLTVKNSGDLSKIFKLQASDLETIEYSTWLKDLIKEKALANGTSKDIVNGNSQKGINPATYTVYTLKNDRDKHDDGTWWTTGEWKGRVAEDDNAEVKLALAGIATTGEVLNPNSKDIYDANGKRYDDPDYDPATGVNYYYLRTHSDLPDFQVGKTYKRLLLVVHFDNYSDYEIPLTSKGITVVKTLPTLHWTDRNPDQDGGWLTPVEADAPLNDNKVSRLSLKVDPDPVNGRPLDPRVYENDETEDSENYTLPVVKYTIDGKVVHGDSTIANPNASYTVEAEYYIGKRNPEREYYFGKESEDTIITTAKLEVFQKTVPTVDWPYRTATQKTFDYGTALTTENVLNATCTGGTVTYTLEGRTPGRITPEQEVVLNMVPDVGNHIVTMTFTPYDTVRYAKVIQTASLTINPVLPYLDWFANDRVRGYFPNFIYGQDSKGKMANYTEFRKNVETKTGNMDDNGKTTFNIPYGKDSTMTYIENIKDMGDCLFYAIDELNLNNDQTLSQAIQKLVDDIKKEGLDQDNTVFVVGYDFSKQELVEDGLYPHRWDNLEQYIGANKSPNASKEPLQYGVPVHFVAIGLKAYRFLSTLSPVENPIQGTLVVQKFNLNKHGLGIGYAVEDGYEKHTSTQRAGLWSDQGRITIKYGDILGQPTVTNAFYGQDAFNNDHYLANWKAIVDNKEVTKWDPDRPGTISYVIRSNDGQKYYNADETMAILKGNADLPVRKGHKKSDGRTPDPSKDDYTLVAIFTPVNQDNYDVVTAERWLEVIKQDITPAWQPKEYIFYGEYLSVDQLNATFTTSYRGQTISKAQNGAIKYYYGKISSFDGDTPVVKNEDWKEVSLSTVTKPENWLSVVWENNYDYVLKVKYSPQGSGYDSDANNYNVTSDVLRNFTVYPVVLTIQPRDLSLNAGERRPVPMPHDVYGLQFNDDLVCPVAKISTRPLAKVFPEPGVYRVIVTNQKEFTTATETWNPLNYTYRFLEGHLYVGKNPIIVWGPLNPVVIDGTYGDCVDPSTAQGPKAYDPLTYVDRDNPGTELAGTWEFTYAGDRIYPTTAIELYHGEVKKNIIGSRTLYATFKPADETYLPSTSQTELWVQDRPVILWAENDRGNLKVEYGKGLTEAQILDYARVVSYANGANIKDKGKLTRTWKVDPNPENKRKEAKVTTGPLYRLELNFEPTTAANQKTYAKANTKPADVEVIKANPQWAAWNPTPTEMWYGSRFSDETHLNARVIGPDVLLNDQGVAQGKITYKVNNPPAVGVNHLYATFTPTDLGNFNISADHEANNTVLVKEAELDLQWKEGAQDKITVTYGAKLGKYFVQKSPVYSKNPDDSAPVAGALDADKMMIDGAKVDPAEALPNASDTPHKMSITFVPTQSDNYKTTTIERDLVVKKQTPELKTTGSWSSSIEYGTFFKPAEWFEVTGTELEETVTLTKNVTWSYKMSKWEYKNPNNKGDGGQWSPFTVNPETELLDFNADAAAMNHTAYKVEVTATPTGDTAVNYNSKKLEKEFTIVPTTNPTPMYPVDQDHPENIIKNMWIYPLDENGENIEGDPIERAWDPNGIDFTKVVTAVSTVTGAKEEGNALQGEFSMTLTRQVEVEQAADAAASTSPSEYTITWNTDSSDVQVFSGNQALKPVDVTSGKYHISVTFTPWGYKYPHPGKNAYDSRGYNKSDYQSYVTRKTAVDPQTQVATDVFLMYIDPAVYITTPWDEQGVAADEAEIAAYPELAKARKYAKSGTVEYPRLNTLMNPLLISYKYANTGSHTYKINDLFNKRKPLDAERYARNNDDKYVVEGTFADNNERVKLTWTVNGVVTPLEKSEIKDLEPGWYTLSMEFTADWDEYRHYFNTVWTKTIYFHVYREEPEAFWHPADIVYMEKEFRDESYPGVDQRNGYANVPGAFYYPGTDMSQTDIPENLWPVTVGIGNAWPTEVKVAKNTIQPPLPYEVYATFVPEDRNTYDVIRVRATPAPDAPEGATSLKVVPDEVMTYWEPTPMKYGETPGPDQFNAYAIAVTPYNGTGALINDTYGKFSYPTNNWPKEAGQHTVVAIFKPNKPQNYVDYWENPGHSDADLYTIRATALLTIEKAVADFVWDHPDPLEMGYDDVFTAEMLKVTSKVPGRAIITCEGKPVAVNMAFSSLKLTGKTQYEMKARWIPTDSKNYAEAPAQTAVLTITNGGISISWDQLSTIGYTTPLDKESYLNATATRNGEDVTTVGTWVYVPAEGTTAQDAQKQIGDKWELITTFTLDGVSESATNSVTVVAASMDIEFADTAVTTEYGQLIDEEIAGVIVTDPATGEPFDDGEFTYSVVPSSEIEWPEWPEGWSISSTGALVKGEGEEVAYVDPSVDVLPVGEYALTATFTPHESEYGEAVSTKTPATLTVTQTEPELEITPLPEGSNSIRVPYGMLIENVLGDTWDYAVSNPYNEDLEVETGSLGYTFTDATGKEISQPLPIGSYGLTVTFNPADDYNYLATTNKAPATVIVGRATPLIEWYPEPIEFAYGTELPQTVLTAKAINNIDKSIVDGHFEYELNGEIIAKTPFTDENPYVPYVLVNMLGEQKLTAVFYPKDEDSYTSPSETIPFTVFTGGLTPVTVRAKDQIINFGELPDLTVSDKTLFVDPKGAATAVLGTDYYVGAPVDVYEITVVSVTPKDATYAIDNPIPGRLTVNPATPTVEFYELLTKDGVESLGEEPLKTISLIYGDVMEFDTEKAIITITNQNKDDDADDDDDDDSEVESASDVTLTADADADDDDEGDDADDDDEPVVVRTIKVVAKDINGDAMDPATIAFTLDGVNVDDVEQPLEPQEEAYTLTVAFTFSNKNYVGVNANIPVTVAVDEDALDVEWPIPSHDFTWTEGNSWAEYGFEKNAEATVYGVKVAEKEDKGLSYWMAKLPADVEIPEDVDPEDLDLEDFGLTVGDLDLAEFDPEAIVAEAGVYYLSALYADTLYGIDADEDIVLFVEPEPVYQDLTVTVDKQQLVYGTEINPTAYTVTPAEFQDIVEVTLVPEVAYVGNVGTYDLFAFVDETTIPEGYKLVTNPVIGKGMLEVTPLSVTVTALDQTIKANQEPDPKAYTVDPKDAPVSVALDFGGYAGVAGEYVITPAAATDNLNYTIAEPVKGTLTVTELVSVTIVPVAAPITYGDPAPAQTAYSYEPADVKIIGTPKYSTLYTAGKPASASGYDIFIDNPNELKAEGYDVVFAKHGKLVVNKATPEFTVVPSTTDLKVGEKLTVSWTTDSDGDVTTAVKGTALKQISATEFEAVEQGEATITATLAETQNYLGATADVTVTVTKKDPIQVTVTAIAGEGMIYGDNVLGGEDGESYLSYTAVDPDGKAVAGTIIYSVKGIDIDYAVEINPAENKYQTLPAADYTVTPKFTPTPVNDEEYEITEVPATLTVGQAPLTVTAGNAVAIYGDPKSLKVEDPTIEGLIGDDTVEYEVSVDYQPDYAVRAYPDAVTVTLVGEYPNYDVTYVNGTLDVLTNTGAASVVWNVPETMVYGTPIVCNAKAYVFGKEVEDKDAVKYFLDDTVEIPADEPLMLFVGKYNLKAVFVAPVGAGYTDAVTSIDIEVTPKALTVTLDDAEVVYGEDLVLPVAKIEGLLEGDMVEYDVTSIYHAGTTSAGTYKDGIIATLSEDSDNYEAPAQVTSTLTVKKATQEVILVVNPTVLNVGDSATATVVTTSGLTDFTLVISDPSILSPNLVALKVGTVTVTAKQAGDKNYEPAESNTVEVTVAPKADVQITWEPKSPITYGTILSAEHLNATAELDGKKVEGHFYYNPTFGYVVTPESPFVVNGKLRLSATFIPTDRKRYKNAYVEVLVDIVVEEDDTTDDGEDAPTLTISKAGSVKGMVNAAADALVITFTGTLEESTDGVTWTPVADAKDGTYVVDVKVASKKFYRSAK